MVEKIILNNGVRVLCERLPHVRSCTIGFWAESGSRHEPEELSGISHFIEHMLFKGTKTRTAQQLACAFDEIGGQVNAFTSKDHTCYYTRTTDAHIQTAVDLLLDMYTQSVFEKKEVDLERGVIFEEIDMYEDTPDDLVNEQLAQEIYKGDPLGMPVLGTKETLSKIDSQTLRDYRDRHYTAARTIVSLCGNVSDEDLSALCEKLEKAIPTGGDKLIDGDVEYKPSMVLKRKKIEQNHVILAFEGIPLGSDDRFAMQVLNNILGAGMSSRLFQKVREEHGLCYSVYSFCTNYIGAGIIGIYVGLSPESEQKAITLIREILEEIKEKGVTTEELRRTREQLKSTLLMGMESTSSRMNVIARNEMIYGREVSEDELIEGIDSVNSEDVQALAQRVFDFDTASLSVVGTIGKKSEYTALLKDKTDK